MTQRTDHVAEAQGHIESAHEQQAREGEYEHSVRDNALLAQVHATLALVEQQRIANLIAIYVADGAAESGFISKGFDFGYMADQIREGLGL